MRGRRPTPGGLLTLQSLLVVAAVLIGYGPSLGLPFIQDDWPLQLRFEQTSAAGFLRSLTPSRGALFFRPLSSLYLYALFRLFGHDALPYHVAALFLHAASGILVVLIGRRLLRDATAAGCAGVLYALAFPVHMESLMWSVGITDLGAGLFVLLSLLLFLDRRTGWSAGAYLVACLFKESAIVFPLVLAAFLLLDAGAERSDRGRARLRDLAPYLPVVVLIAAIKAAGAPVWRLPASHPYLLRLAGVHLVTNAAAYAVWLGESVFPLEIRRLGAAGIYGPAAAVLGAFVLGWQAAWSTGDRSVRRLLMSLAVWTAAPLLAVLFLPNHRFRYYAGYSVPALVLTALLLMKVVLERHGVDLRRVRRWWIGATALSATLSVVASQVVFSEGQAQQTFATGTNRLVRRAAFVQIVRSGLQDLLPVVPPRAVLVIGGVELPAFGKEAGPRVWYGRRDIEVYALERVRQDERGIYVDDEVEDGEAPGVWNRRRELTGLTVYAFSLADGRLQPVDLRRH